MFFWVVNSSLIIIPLPLPAPVALTSCAAPYPSSVTFREKVFKLASALKASIIVPMPNAEADFEGPLGNVVTEANTEEEFLELARREGVKVVMVKAAEGIDVWP